jgi:hypothetical protein
MALVLNVHKLLPRSHSVEELLETSMVFNDGMKDKKYLLNSKNPPIKHNLLIIR